MWLLMTLVGLPYIVPRLVERSAVRIMDLTPEELKASGGSAIKAATKKQTAMFADGLEGAIGKVIQTAPDGQLDALAKQYGFPDAKTAAAQLVGANGGVPGVGGAGGALQALQALGGSKGGGFSRIVELVSALQAFGNFGGVASGGSSVGSSGGSVSSGGRTW